MLGKEKSLFVRSWSILNWSLTSAPAENVEDVGSFFLDPRLEVELLEWRRALAGRTASGVDLDSDSPTLKHNSIDKH